MFGLSRRYGQGTGLRFNKQYLEGTLRGDAKWAESDDATAEGGSGSGFFGHSGRPGQEGGSAPRGDGGSNTGTSAKPKTYGTTRQYTLSPVNDVEADATFFNPRQPQYPNLLRISYSRGSGEISLAEPGMGGNFNLSYKWLVSRIPIRASKVEIRAKIKDAALYGSNIGRFFDRDTEGGLDDVVDAVVRAQRHFRKATAARESLSMSPTQRYTEGGPGSGYFGHAGRPGKVGGSAPSGAVGASAAVPNVRMAATDARRRILALPSAKRFAEIEERWRQACLARDPSVKKANALHDTVPYMQWRTDPQMRAASAELDAHNKIVYALDAEMAAARIALQADAMQFLRVDTPSTVVIDSTMKGDLAEDVRGQVDVCRSLIGDGSLDGKTVKVRSSLPRAGWCKDLTIGLAQHDSWTFTHEFGHAWEHSNPDLFARAKAFRDKRTAGERAIPLPGSRGVVHRPDKFISPYAGKIYTFQGKEYATEILSTGLEFMGTDAARLAREDPSYFDFMYETLRGDQP
jgi:hypothetical protein